jgi:hypothetical protein
VTQWLTGSLAEGLGAATSRVPDLAAGPAGAQSTATAKGGCLLAVCRWVSLPAGLGLSSAKRYANQRHARSKITAGGCWGGCKLHVDMSATTTVALPTRESTAWRKKDYSRVAIVAHLEACEVPPCQHLQEDCWLPPVAGVALLHQLQDKPTMIHIASQQIHGVMPLQ